MLAPLTAVTATDAEAIAASLTTPRAFAAVFERHFDAIHRFLRGRVGTTLAEEGGQRQRLVFDPDTSQILVEQDVLTKRVPDVDADPGFVMGYRIVLEQGVVKSDTARP